MATKKKFGIGMAAIAAGAGATAIAVKKHRKAENEGKQKEASASGERQEYRNTERGKNQKNSKGIYYTNGNYEAFARPKKPEGVEDKNAYIVGSGLAALATACFPSLPKAIPMPTSAGGCPTSLPLTF